MLYVGMVNMCYASSNCTFMELKSQMPCVNYKSLHGSNCTFMELKFAGGYQALGSSISF